MAGSRTFVHEDIYDDFLAKAIELAKTKKVGDPFAPDTENGNVADTTSKLIIFSYPSNRLSIQ